MKEKLKNRGTAFDAMLSQATSEAQAAANRANAWKSTGPASETGKRISSMNALKTGLTGKTVLLSSDDADLYRRHVERFFSDLKPVGERESELAQSMAGAQWRLNRIPGLEMGIYALGRLQFADQFSSHAPAIAAALVESYIFLQRQKELKNLAIQESRLRRQYQKDAAELAQLQKERATQPVVASNTVLPQSETPAQSTASESLNGNGFEFSNSPAAPVSSIPPGVKMEIRSPLTPDLQLK